MTKFTRFPAGKKQASELSFGSAAFMFFVVRLLAAHNAAFNTGIAAAKTSLVQFDQLFYYFWCTVRVLCNFGELNATKDDYSIFYEWVAAQRKIIMAPVAKRGPCWRVVHNQSEPTNWRTTK